MTQMVRQREWDTRTRGGEDGRRTGQPDGRRFEHPRDELVLTLAKLGALLLEQLPPSSPGEHQERDDAGHQKREPAALDQLCQVRGNEDEFNDKEESVYGRDQ